MTVGIAVGAGHGVLLGESFAPGDGESLFRIAIASLSRGPGRECPSLSGCPRPGLRLWWAIPPAPGAMRRGTPPSRRQPTSLIALRDRRPLWRYSVRVEPAGRPAQCGGGRRQASANRPPQLLLETDGLRWQYRARELSAGRPAQSGGWQRRQAGANIPVRLLCETDGLRCALAIPRAGEARRLPDAIRRVATPPNRRNPAGDDHPAAPSDGG